MSQIILLPNEMFQNDKDINCFNLIIHDRDGGEQFWDVDIFETRYPLIHKLLVAQFEKGEYYLELKRAGVWLSLSLV